MVAQMIFCTLTLAGPQPQQACAHPQRRRQQADRQLQLRQSEEQVESELLVRSVPQLSSFPNLYGFGFVCTDSTCRIQPPSIRPISASGSESATYFLLSNAFSSRATCKKNLSPSSLVVALRIQGNFSVLLK